MLAYPVGTAGVVLGDTLGYGLARYNGGTEKDVQEAKGNLRESVAALALGKAVGLVAKPVFAGLERLAARAGGYLEGLAGRMGGLRGSAGAVEEASASRVLHASELGSLPEAAPGTNTIVLGPFSRRVRVSLSNGGSISGLENALETVLRPAADRLGGRTLSGMPGEIGALAPAIQSADRIVFFTASKLGPLTQVEMDFIQGSEVLMRKTTFVFGGIK